MTTTTARPEAAPELSKGARTRERILQVSADLFHRQGVNATTLGDVLRESNAGKGQFYLHFKDRADLVHQVLARNRSFVEQQVAVPIADWAGLKHWMDQHLTMQRRFRFERGCPIGTAAYALQADQAQARTELKAAFDSMRHEIVAFLQSERAAGRLAQEADPRALADFAAACVQGGLLLGVLERSGRAVKSAIDEGFAHLRSYARPGPRRPARAPR